MKKLGFAFRPSLKIRPECSGMSLIELLIAVNMLVVFTGVVAMVMQFALRFFSVAESGEQDEFKVSNGVLIDHQQIQMAMDGLVEVLSQPGISLERLKGQEPCSISDSPSSCSACTNDFDRNCRNQIAFDFDSATPGLACAPVSPVTHWSLPILEEEEELIESKFDLPPGYRLCLWTTTQREGAVELVVDDDGKQQVRATPGIYLLQALPEQLSASSLPTRRLFCRPRPFC